MFKVFYEYYYYCNRLYLISEVWTFQWVNLLRTPWETLYTTSEITEKSCSLFTGTKTDTYTTDLYQENQTFSLEDRQCVSHFKTHVSQTLSKDDTVREEGVGFFLSCSDKSEIFEHPAGIIWTNWCTEHLKNKITKKLFVCLGDTSFTFS